MSEWLQTHNGLAQLQVEGVGPPAKLSPGAGLNGKADWVLCNTGVCFWSFSHLLSDLINVYSLHGVRQLG